MKRFVIGLTGGIASGKSTVLSLLRARGVATVSSDEIAHRCLRSGTPVYHRVVRLFGARIMAPDRSIRRTALAAIVFRDPVARRRLERLVHPCVVRELRAFARGRRGLVVMDIPLLFEARLRSLVDWVVVVRATPAQQLSRLRHRSGLSRADALRRIRAQWPIARKCRLADEVIDNTGSLPRLSRLTRQWIEKTLDTRPV